MVLIMVVNSMLLGLLTAAICLTAGAPSWLIVALGTVVAVAFFIGSVLRGQRIYLGVWKRFEPLNPTP